MAEVLYLNKQQVDIYEGKITRKIQIGDVGDIGARKSSFSYTIKIPKTSRNKVVFEMLGTQGNTSRKPYEEISADYIVDGIYLVSNGIAVIKDTVEDYSLNIIDGIRSLSDLLKGKKLSQLPLEDLNHILTTSNYTESYENTEGYIYGLADFGQGVSSTVKVEKQAPSIFTHTLFRRIFESNGLTLQGEFFTTNQRYLNEVVTPAKGYTVNDVSFTENAKGGHDSSRLSDYQYSNDYISFTDKITLTNNGLVGASISNGEILFSVGGTYKLVVDVDYSVYKTYMSVQFRVNGSTESSIYCHSDASSAERTITFTVKSGDRVSFYASGSSEWQYDYEGDPDDGGYRYEVNYWVEVAGTLSLLTGGQLIQPSDYIGDMNQITFIKDVANRYGLLLHPVQNTNEFRFIRMEALLSDRAAAEDWTDKFVSVDGENYVSGYAKTNKAAFKYPSEIVIPSNNGEMEIDNKNANEEKTLFSSDFEIPNTGSYLSGQRVYKIPIWNTVPENLETPLKVMNISRFNKTITAKLFTEVTGITVSENVPFLNLNFIDMQYYINEFYRSFQSLIDNYRKMTFKMNLTVIDVFNLDFFRLKFLKQTGRFYYMVSVQNSIGKVSKVAMIEIAEFLGNRPPSQIGSFTFNLQRLATRTITNANILNGYEDPELDDALKVKIKSGFNADVLLKQDGTTITSETEILMSDLKLTAVEVLGGVDDYIKKWAFTIADKGSGEYRDGLLEAEEIIEGGYINPSGTVNSQADMAYDKYTIEAGLFYFITATYNSNYGGFFVASYYDENDSFIGNEALVSNGVIDDQDRILTPPTDTAYILINRQINKSTTVEDNYGVLKANVLEFNNYAPVADAGDDVSQELTDPYYVTGISNYASLTGAGSYDNTGEIVSYKWTITDKPTNSTATITDSTSRNTSLRAENIEDNVGTYTLQLLVTDEFGLTDTDTMKVEFTNNNWNITPV